MHDKAVCKTALQNGSDLQLPGIILQVNPLHTSGSTYDIVCQSIGAVTDDLSCQPTADQQATPALCSMLQPGKMW